MKKRSNIIVYCLLLSAVAAAIVFLLRESGVFIFDRSAAVHSNHVVWNGKEYSNIYGEYTEGRIIAKDKTGDWTINSVEEDPTQTFIVARSFLDQYLMVSDNYPVPTSGKLTAVAWNGAYITETIFLDAISKIDSEKTTSFTYETEGIFQFTENQHMSPLYFAYENCPVATNFNGYMGQVNSEWVITTYISQDTQNNDGSPNEYSVSCYAIPREYWDILSQFFS